MAAEKSGRAFATQWKVLTVGWSGGEVLIPLFLVMFFFAFFT